MTQTASTRGLVELRRKTDLQLFALIRNEVEKGIEIAEEDPERAARLHEEAQRLLPLARFNGPERHHVQQRLEELAQALACGREACA